MMSKFCISLVDYDEEIFQITPEILNDMHNTASLGKARLEIGTYRNEKDVLQAAQHADVVMIQSVRPLLNRQVISKLDKCRGLIRMGLGYDSIDIAAASEAGIPACNVVDWCNDEVAEHALALMFACVRQLTPLNRDIRQNNWSRVLARPIRRIQGAVLGIIGLGRTGRELAIRAKALGMQVMAYDPFVSANDMREMGVVPNNLYYLLEQSDFISLHLPLTTDTYHLLDSQAINHIKPGALLINTSRGEVIDEQALVNALVKGQLGGAGLDVFTEEPLPADSLLLQIDNVILTPHIASYSQEANKSLYSRSIETAVNILKGKWLPTIINQDAQESILNRWQRLNQEN